MRRIGFEFTRFKSVFRIENTQMDLKCTISFKKNFNAKYNYVRRR